MKKNLDTKSPPLSEGDLGGGTALLFINGEPPKDLPEISTFYIAACTDGAFHYLKEKNFPLEKLDFISGDFDSHSGWEADFPQEKFIETPDQDKTDFEKALEILIEKGAKQVDVYGGSGGEMDHFLGNLSTATKFENILKIKFIDEYSTYYFLENKEIIRNVKGKMISLYPFPMAENVTTIGLNWELKNETLTMDGKISTRNFARENAVQIKFAKGRLLIFIGKNKY